MKNPVDLHQALRELVVVQQPVAVAIAQLPPGGFAQQNQASLVQNHANVSLCVSFKYPEMPQILAAI